MASNITEIENGIGNFQLWLGFLLSFLLFLVSFLNLKSISWTTGNKKKITEAIDNIPGPRPIPLVGNVHQCLKLLHSETELVGWTREMVTKFGPVVRVWNFGRPNVLISSSDLAIKLQKEGAVDDKAADLKDYAVAINGIGLVSLPPEGHARHKKFWNPFFNWRNIESVLPDMQEEGIKVVNHLEQYAGRDSISPCKVFNLPPYATRATFNITCCTAFGKDFMDTMSDDTANEYMHDFHTVAVNLSRRTFRPWLNKDFIYYSTPEGRSTKRSAERGTSLMKEAIAFRRNLRNCGSNCIQGDYKCFLDRLLDMQEQGVLNEAQIVGELNVFVAGGYDTSAIVISLVMYQLAIHPDHQEKIVQELQEVLGPDFGSNNNYPLTWDIIKNFKHLDLCIKESLRLYPLVPVLPRRSTQDIKLEDGKMIPKGVDVYILTDIIHRDPKYFKDPSYPRDTQELPFQLSCHFPSGTEPVLAKLWEW